MTTTQYIIPKKRALFEEKAPEKGAWCPNMKSSVRDGVIVGEVSCNTQLEYSGDGDYLFCPVCQDTIYSRYDYQAIGSVI